RLAKDVAVADLESRRLALVLLVLRRIADRGELIDLVAGADARRAVDHRMRSDPAARADRYARTDDAEGADLHVGGNVRLRRDHRARVDHPTAPVPGGLCAFAGALVSGATMISAEATSAPSTSAR